MISIEFGAEVWIGVIKDGTNDHAIKVAGYFGVDPNKPEDNYVYASISAFTLDSVFKAFELGTPDMPKFVRETGFPEGITVAYSLKGKHWIAHYVASFGLSTTPYLPVLNKQRLQFGFHKILQL